MSGITELEELLRSMRPALLDAEFVFCTVPGDLSDYIRLNPIATFIEAEGLTLVLNKTIAEDAGLSFEGSFRQITLTVHSSLEAVGLTAAVSAKLASEGISANVIAAYYHDHIFVQSAKADAALSALLEFSTQDGQTDIKQIKRD
ncbi:ACT domain-containing protein [Vibrio quintilis]|uniref:ACT domain protein n=1 Tax=Vibrio quintilis TaxID=1117707 RepID=A0A1M7YQT3_9VIBR|nr:ACT domain-containing protein [Vibrio quintilis]SHO54991.1 ACT domain protein [Vibrio quintilis]